MTLGPDVCDKEHKVMCHVIQDIVPPMRAECMKKKVEENVKNQKSKKRSTMGKNERNLVSKRKL
jgi:hypothetical protein